MTELFKILGGLNNNLVTLVSIVGSVGVLGAMVKKWLRAEIDKVDMQQTKNFLTRSLADIERGVKLTEVEELRIKETYQWYVDHKGNTYIKDKYKALEEKKLI